jgi:sec1 family domain-containing protein 1
MIPDVPVIYLVEPTSKNLQAITDDLSRGLYSPAYINFLTSVPRPLLEDFAAQVATSGIAEHISQVFDQYLNFVVSEPDLFSLAMGDDVYWTMNSATIEDEALDKCVDRIVSGLFSVVVTTGRRWTVSERWHEADHLQEPFPSFAAPRAVQQR